MSDRQTEKQRDRGSGGQEIQRDRQTDRLKERKKERRRKKD